MTTITDTVTYIDGSTAQGKIILTWPPFQFSGVAIAGGQQEYPIVAGVVTITCYPTIGAQPFGVYYTATYELDKGAVYDEYWIVPSQATASIATVRVQVPTTPSIMINAQQLTSSGALAGQFLGWNGASWVPMYVSNFNCAVRSFFGRMGDVLPQTGDYTVDQITGAVGQTRQILAGTGLTGGGDLSSDVTLSVVPNTTVQKIEVAADGTVSPHARKQLNFVSGTDILVSVQDDPGNDRADVRFMVTASGGGVAAPGIYGINGNPIGTEVFLNLIEGNNIALSGVNVPGGAPGSGRVDITITGTSIWTQNPDGSISFPGSVNIVDPGGVGGYGFTINGMPVTTNAAGSGGQVQFNLWNQFAASPNFYYDAINVRLGIGTSSPGAALTVVNNTSPVHTGISSASFTDDDIGAIFYCRKTRGTQASPQPIQAGDYVGYLGFGGLVPGFSGDQASIGVADPTGTGTGDILFLTNDGTGMQAGYERLRITHSGNVGIGVIPQANLDMAGTLMLRGTLPLVSPSIGPALRLGCEPSAYGADILSWDFTASVFRPLTIRGSSTMINPGGGPVQIGDNGVGPGIGGDALDIGSGNFGGGYSVLGIYCQDPARVWVGTRGSYRLELGVAGVSAIFITPGNNYVGIGQWSPQASLHVYTNYNPAVTAASAILVQGAYGGGIQLQDGYDYLGIWSNGGHMQFGAGGTSAGYGTADGSMVLTKTGWVGIGARWNQIADPLTIAGLGGGQLRLVYGGYGLIFRNDGSTFYMMVTNPGDPYGSWSGNNWPMVADLAQGTVSIGIDQRPTPGYHLTTGNFKCNCIVFGDNTMQCTAAAAVTALTSLGGRAFNTVYWTGAKPRFITITVYIFGGTLDARTDTGNPPTTTVVHIPTATSYAYSCSCSFWVMPYSYYQVITTGTVTLGSWAEWE